jgi:hypothetical protein
VDQDDEDQRRGRERKRGCGVRFHQFRQHEHMRHDEHDVESDEQNRNGRMKDSAPGEQHPNGADRPVQRNSQCSVPSGFPTACGG